MTTNHPAHDPVSLVRLHQISEILSKAAAQSDGGNLGYAMADAVKVIDGAIAAFGAKLDENGLLPCPLCGGGAEFDYDDDNLNWISCSACGISTDTVYHTDIDARDKLREVWNRRTAMLQGGNSPVTPDCSCRTCRPVTFTDSRFVVCPECGNKRCPHANDHNNACTGNNETGQVGSASPSAPQQEVES
ncbi:Lar family restriction alleviation protein [Salmonella enterica]|nr:Lar family restriction alleviation protein [Salmonella enterica]